MIRDSIASCLFFRTAHYYKVITKLACKWAGVISNILYSGSAVKDRINALLPKNYFEFIKMTEFLKDIK